MMEDLRGEVVSEEYVSNDLGFRSVDDFRAWIAAGGPTGRCSNGQCWRPAFWPDLDKPCPHCGSPIAVDAANPNPEVHEQSGGDPCSSS